MGVGRQRPDLARMEGFPFLEGTLRTRLRSDIASHCAPSRSRGQTNMQASRHQHAMKHVSRPQARHRHQEGKGGGTEELCNFSPPRAIIPCRGCCPRETASDVIGNDLMWRVWPGCGAEAWSRGNTPLRREHPCRLSSERRPPAIPLHTLLLRTNAVISLKIVVSLAHPKRHEALALGLLLNAHLHVAPGR